MANEVFLRTFSAPVACFWIAAGQSYRKRKVGKVGIDRIHLMRGRAPHRTVGEGLKPARCCINHKKKAHPQRAGLLVSDDF